MDNLRTCLAFFSAFEDSNIERMITLCTQDAVIDFEPFGDSFSGTVEGIGRIVWTAFIESFPDMKVTLQDISWNGTGTVAHCAITIRGTQLYPFIGIAKTGRNLSILQQFYLEFDLESKIKVIRVRWNHEDFVKQLTQET